MYPRTVESDDAVISRVWRAAGQPNPFNPQSTPRLRAKLKSAPSYGRALRAQQNAIERPGDTARVKALWNAADAAAKEAHGSISEVLYVVMVESIKGVNKDKRMALEKLQELNDINDALGDALKDLSDTSRRLADRESNGDADAKEQVVYTRYETRTAGPAKLTTVRKTMTRSQLSSEMKMLESEREDLRNSKQKAQNEFQHVDQVVNQAMQSLTRILRTLGDMRKQGAASRSGL